MTIALVALDPLKLVLSGAPTTSATPHLFLVKNPHGKQTAAQPPHRLEANGPPQLRAPQCGTSAISKLFVKIV
jgi:hypothetical protein